MTNSAGQRVIALEEHYYDAGLTALWDSDNNRRRPSHTVERLLEVGEKRIAEMDAAGIDIQVLSHGAPSTQRLDPETAVTVAREVNDRLHALIKAKPSRFRGFAALPTPDPAAAADELDRAVSELGFKGAMIHGLTNDAFIDEVRFWPIFERAQNLDVPIYLHPARPHQNVIDAYYGDMAKRFPAILGAGWGFTVETATAGLRLILSGLFDHCPDVKIILGHLGESLPFMVWRVDQAFNRPGNAGVAFRDIFCRNFYITTSGFFSDPALLCSIQEIGVDHILFSIDWPFVENRPGADWFEATSISASDKEKILNGNARRILNMSMSTTWG